MYEIGAGMSVGRLAYFHDLRKGEIPNNVDRSRIKDNVVLVDEIKGRSIEEWINDEMQEHIDHYNAKQKRSDRKIKEKYVDWHKNNGNYNQNKKIDHVRIATEFVLNYGGQENIGGEYTSPLTSPKRKKEIYDQAVRLYSKWIDDMKEMYPHIKIGMAVIHADEATIHLHGIAIPQATYSRGLPVQCSWTRALEQDGIEAIKDKELAKEAGGFQLARFYKQFREHMILDLKQEQHPGDNGDMVSCFTIKKEEHGKKHIDSNQYTELMTEATQTMAEAEKAIEEAKKIDLFTKELKAIEEMGRVPEYDPSKTKTIQYKESILSKPVELEAMPKENLDALRADAGARKVAFDAEDKIKRQKKVMDKFLENITQSDREKQLIRENEELKAKLEEKDLELSRITKNYETLKTQITQFLKQFKEINLFQKFKNYLISWKQEWHKPEFTTPTQERKDRER